MVGARITSALLVGCLATSAWAGDRNASFRVSVRVVAPLRKPAAAAAPPAQYLVRDGVAAPACAAPGCTPAPAGPSGTVVVTSFADGNPTSVVER